MSDNLQQLEREVEAARARLAGDLSTLRSPSTFSQFTAGLKDEALDVKDALLDKAKTSARSMLDDMVETVKAKAAANPTAVLAIAAGIAWRLVQRPPIATALIGAGLWSLLRAAPARVNGRADSDYLAHARNRLKEQAGDFAETVRDEAVAVGGTLKEKASELAGATKHRVQQLSADAQSAARDTAAGIGERAKQWSTEAQTMARETASEIGDRASSLRGRASDTLSELRQPERMDGEWSSPFPEGVTEQETRNTVLLGAAGVAVVTALGLAYQRRMREDAEVD